MSLKKITVIPGDGIGPEIVDATIRVLDKLDCGFEYHYVEAGMKCLDKGNDLLPKETLYSIKMNDATLKGPLTTPVAGGFRSINVTLRQQFDLYANVRPTISFRGTQSRYENVDIIIVRENTEGMYSGKGQTLDENGQIAEAMSVVTKEGSERVVKYAFDLARQKGRKKVTVVHKANILKSTSGLFLKTAREVAQQYADIECNEMIVDAACMNLVMKPEKFDVIVTTNLFGDILSDLCAGLVGGLGMAPGANIGKTTAIFEAVHGSAPDIAGQNIANPTSVMLAAALMLDYLNMNAKADRIRKALKETIEQKDRCTPDLGGSGTTTSFTEALIERLTP